MSVVYASDVMEVSVLKERESISFVVSVVRFEEGDDLHRVHEYIESHECGQTRDCQCDS